MELRRPALESLALALLACVPFLLSLGGGFVYDDVPLVEEDPRVQQGDVIGALTEPYWGWRHGGLFRPVTTLSFVLNGLVTRDAWLFRCTNVALHAACTLVAFALARRVLRDRRAALFAAAVFAVHPIHAEVAANVVGRGESLAFLLGGGAWLLALDDEHRVRARRLLPAALLAALGALAKESGLALALAAPLEALVLGARPRARAVALALVPAAFALFAALGARAAALGGGLLVPHVVDVGANPLADDGLATRLANVPLLVVFYARNLCWPLSLSPDYGGATLPLLARPLSWAGAGWLAAALALVALPALAGGRRALFAVAFSLLALAPVLQLAPIGTLAGDRLAYSASLGFALLLGLAFAAAARRRPAPTFAGGAALLAALAIVAALDARAWADPVLLFERARARAPGSSQVPYALATLRMRRGEKAQAIEPLEAALALSPGDGNVLLLLGQVRADLGDLPAARADLERALALGIWDEPRGRVLLALVHLRLGDAPAAARELEHAARLAPDDADVLLRLGQVRRQLGDPQRARETLERALALGPLDEAKGRVQLGLVLGELGDLAGAERELRRVTELEPDVGLWHLALAEVLRDRGDVRGARDAFERGLALDPDNPQASEIRSWIASLPP